MGLAAKIEYNSHVVLQGSTNALQLCVAEAAAMQQERYDLSTLLHPSGRFNLNVKPNFK